MRIGAMGVGWYAREDYPRILHVMEDAHKLPRTYDEFSKSFESVERQVKSQGAVLVRAIIKPDEFVVWCRSRGLKVDAQARMRFANEAALDVVQNKQ